MKNIYRLFLTGFAMGSADIVPGVSGGTIAFIFGVYEELIYSIKKVTGETLQLVLQGKLKKSFESIPFSFLIPLGLGMITAIVALASTISHLLETQPVYLWSFFFGLIVASIIIIRRRVVTWDMHDIVSLAAAALVAFLIVGAVPVQTPASLFAFFFSGMVAIIAMILPGISGSFLLVLMGKYEQILNAVVERDFLSLIAVMAGAVVGIAVFSRVLSWLFSRHHDIAIATLTGFMVGSLRKIWPWKAGTTNIIPEFDQNVIIPLVLMIFAAAAMLYLEKMHSMDEHTEDIEDKKFTSKHKEAVSSQKH